MNTESSPVGETNRVGRFSALLYAVMASFKKGKSAMAASFARAKERAVNLLKLAPVIVIGLLIVSFLYSLVIGPAAIAALKNLLFGNSMQSVRPTPQFSNFDFLSFGGDEDSKNKILVIPVSGVIHDGIVSDFEMALKVAKEDKNVKAVILEVQSPGGSTNASELLHHELQKFKESSKKPVVAFFNGFAASGGYYVSAPADKIIATPETITGSIGVIMQVRNYSGLLAKIGVTHNTVTSGPRKDMLSPFKPIDPADTAIAKSIVDISYGRFVKVVASGRKMKKETVLKLADGRIYDASQALQNGLIDQIGYLKEEGFDTAKNLAEIEKAQLVYLAKRPSMILGPVQRVIELIKEYFGVLSVMKPGLYYIALGFVGT